MAIVIRAIIDSDYLIIYRDDKSDKGTPDVSKYYHIPITVNSLMARTRITSIVLSSRLEC